MNHHIFDIDCPEKSLKLFAARALARDPSLTSAGLERLIVVEGGGRCLRELGEQWRLGDPLVVERLLMDQGAPPLGRMCGADRGELGA